MKKEDITEMIQTIITEYNFEINDSFVEALEHYHTMIENGMIVPRDNQTAVDYNKEKCNYKL